MIVRLTLLSALEILAFSAALVAYLKRIASVLERIGGTGDSFLAKIAFGVRAIEKESSHLAPQVAQLNHSLLLLNHKLDVVDQHLASVAETLSGSAGKEAAA